MKQEKWSGEINQTAFVYYQGKDSSQLQAVKYLGGSPMKASTGESAIFTHRGIATIPSKRLWVYPEIDEINRRPRFSILSRLKHYWRGIRLTADPGDTPMPMYPTNESGSVHRYSVRNSKRSLGQSTDIQAHQNKVEQLNKLAPEVNNIICYGVSRGSATTFAAIATNQYENVKLCVLEAPPGSIRSLVKSKFPRFIGKLIYNSPMTKLLIGKQHSRDKSAQAQAYVDRFPLDLPLVIISSKSDTTVPHKNSLKLAQMVASKRIIARSNGQKTAPVYFIQLDKPDHNDYSLIDKFPEDVKRYQSTLHAIYRKHQLPYIETLANDGDQYINDCVMTEGFLQSHVLLQSAFKNNKEQRAAILKNAFEEISKEPSSRKQSIASCFKMFDKSKSTHNIPVPNTSTIYEVRHK